jgi:hypothetical protein
MITLESTKSEIDDALWDAVSIYYRMLYTDDKGYGRCYTCGKVIHYKKCDLGHWLSRAYKAIKFNPKHLRTQCKQCNGYGNGRPDVFRDNLVDEIGEEEVNWLNTHKNDPHPTKEFMFSELQRYKQLTKNLPLKALE